MESTEIKSLNISVAVEQYTFEFNEELQLYYSPKEKTDKIEILFTNCIFKKGLHFNIDIRKSQLKELQLTFDNCIFEETKNEQKILSNKLKQNIFLHFHSCFIKDLVFKKSVFQHLYVGKSLFGSRLLIEQTNIDIITIRNCFGDFFLNGNSKTKLFIVYSDDNLFIEDTQIRKLNRIFIKTHSLERIFAYKTNYYISDFKELNFNFSKQNKSGIKREEKPDRSGDEYKYYLTDHDLNLLNISLSATIQNEDSEKVKIQNGLFNSLTLKGESQATIDIKHTKTNSLFIHSFSSKNFRLYDFSSKGQSSKLEIKDSDLNNTWFDKVQLNSFSIVSFYRTTVEKMKFSATEFPRSIEALENIHYPNRRELDYYKNKYETYKQLKIALLNQHNQIQALQMHSKMYESIRHSTTLTSQDRLILFLNDISNKHGTSIFNAFLCFIISGITLFIIYNLVLPDAPYQIGWRSLEDFIWANRNTSVFIMENWRNFYVLINPTHRISQLIEYSPSNSISWGNYLISFLSRIIIGWAIYQFILAFRKFGRSI